MNDVIHYDLDSSGGSGRSEAQRRQRNALIGLSIGSALVLFLGVTAVLLTGSNGGDADIETVVPSSVAPVTTITTTTSSTTTSTTTTSTTSTTLGQADAVADAGDDLVVASGRVVTLDALEVTDGALDTDIMWRQTLGPDVTAGLGALGGRSVSFGAPDDVVTLGFDLVVDAAGAEATDSLLVRVFENGETAVFVDGDTGDDDADGSMDSPLRTISAGVAAAVDGADVHVRSGPVYAEVDTIRLGAGTSLYGGFVDDWMRDASQRVQIDGAPVAISGTGGGDRRLSALEVMSRDAVLGGDAIAVRLDGGDTITISDSRLVAGDAGDARRDDAGQLVLAGVSAGVFATGAGDLLIERSTINAGTGGNGVPGGAGGDGEMAGSGQDGAGASGGSGADAEGSQRGGDAGDGGADGSDGGSRFAAGGDSGSDPVGDGEPGSGGRGGDGGGGGDGGVGMVVGDRVIPVGAPGRPGAPGGPGIGAGGGGGGAAGEDDGGDAVGDGSVPTTAGGGGGGGAGGDGGEGGLTGAGGGGSVGIWAVDFDTVIVAESLVAAGRGGSGAAGGAGGNGGAGGSGGRGAQGGGEVVIGGAGGGGGGGGAGGLGGAGGGGAGGPSFGLLTEGVGEVVAGDSTIRSGLGGAGAGGGFGGVGGGSGLDGVARSGGDGGVPGRGAGAARGVGASGGSSYGWFDDGGADDRLERAEFLEGPAGRGGDGAIRGEDGVSASSGTG